VMFRDGYLTEGSSSNVFAVKKGVLLAPPKNHLVLPGITYDVVLELAALKNVPVEVREVAESEVRGADELWLTSSSKEVLAITRLDGKPFREVPVVALENVPVAGILGRGWDTLRLLFR